MSVVGLLLAAGSSTRFGAEKLLAALPDGTPMAAECARILRRGLGPGAPLLAVVRPEQGELAALLEGEGFVVLGSPRARDGMGFSLADGVTEARRRWPQAAGWLVALADMPFVRVDTVAAVARAVEEGAAIAAPYEGDMRGHPVGFSAALGDELVALEGDEGARHVVAAHSHQLVRVPVRDLGVLMDIDTPEDLEHTAPFPELP